MDGFEVFKRIEIQLVKILRRLLLNTLANITLSHPLIKDVHVNYIEIRILAYSSMFSY